jgi:uncharacterized membrane protein
MSAITLFYPPEKINTGYGYRTKASMRNQQTWDEANRYSSRLMLFCGLALLIIGLLSFFVSFLRQTGIIAGTILTFFIYAVAHSAYGTAFKKKFGKEGIDN